MPGAEETAESTCNTSIKETVESVKLPQLEENAESAPKAKRPKITLKTRTVVRDAVSTIQGDASDSIEVHTATSIGTVAPVQVPVSKTTSTDNNPVDDQTKGDQEVDASDIGKAEAAATNQADADQEGDTPTVDFETLISDANKEIDEAIEEARLKQQKDEAEAARIKEAADVAKKAKVAEKAEETGEAESRKVLTVDEIHRHYSG